MADLGGTVVCGCCPADHSHDAAANACDQAHEGDCAKGVAGCSVCRPVIITAMPGSGQAVFARTEELRSELARLGVST
jgi:hypothetical protein